MIIRALLLDDDVDLLRFLQAELSDRGYDVTLAKSGDCALAKPKPTDRSMSRCWMCGCRARRDSMSVARCRRLVQTCRSC